MIIKTTNKKETKIASGLKASLREQGVEVFVVPHGVDWIFVTSYKIIDDNLITVLAIKDENAETLDYTIGFDSCKEAYTYAKKLAFASGLDDNCVDGDIWDPEEEAE